MRFLNCQKSLTLPYFPPATITFTRGFWVSRFFQSYPSGRHVKTYMFSRCFIQKSISVLSWKNSQTLWKLPPYATLRLYLSVHEIFTVPFCKFANVKHHNLWAYRVTSRVCPTGYIKEKMAHPTHDHDILPLYLFSHWQFSSISHALDTLWKFHG